MKTNDIRFAGPGRHGVTFIALWAASILGWPANAAAAGETKGDPNRILQYRGPMPMLDKSFWGGEPELRFELYRSPAGGTPFWSETRKVPVSAEGWVSIDLGQVEPLSDEAFTTPFRFLSISQQGEEFGPRKQVVSVVYVAAADESATAVDDYLGSALAAAKAAAAKAPGREARLDALVNCGNYSMETHPRMPATWLDACRIASALHAGLPTFEEWYGAYDGKPGKELDGMVGHYEWVVPWVYEPMIHARMHELYKGKPVACYYNELSPLNAYPFRLLKRSPPETPGK